MDAVDSDACGAGGAGQDRVVGFAGGGNARIAVEVGTTTTSVWKWRSRYGASGLDGLVDAPRAGRPKEVDDERVIAATLTAPPKKLGVTHWSSRLLADHLKVGNDGAQLNLPSPAY
ncbi:helix-turn-helix domain-containing protein [Nakamurella sp. A5-74]|uniref:Helix-turn-helix domain-containing protein n=1 Tax=Nakamurella sp. A5-74 TaxID=3158264 RepID=A0AAU8DRE0_9ACTN